MVGEIESLDGESSAKVCRDREEVSSVSANKVPKPKPVPLRLPASKQRKQVVGEAHTHINSQSVGRFWFRDLICKNGKCHVKTLVQSLPQDVFCTHPVGISNTLIDCAAFSIK